MAAAKISELVNAVKRWTYSGQGPVQDVDLNQVIQRQRHPPEAQGIGQEARIDTLRRALRRFRRGESS